MRAGASDRDTLNFKSVHCNGDQLQVFGSPARHYVMLRYLNGLD